MIDLKVNKLIIGAAMAVGLTIGTGIKIPEVEAARTDMIDVSNHQGTITTAEYTSMRNSYGVKAVTAKISEGTYYHLSLIHI